MRDCLRDEDGDEEEGDEEGEKEEGDEGDEGEKEGEGEEGEEEDAMGAQEGGEDGRGSSVHCDAGAGVSSERRKCKWLHAHNT